MKTPAYTFPAAVMGSHIAVVGKTGSGKTITTKLIIEQAYAEGANVCILDPIKSDHWGLTLDADGKRPGLPFHILGGPYGHVPLHPGAGAALGRLVATGQLRHSVIDMKLFGPGELNGFYNAFAEQLFQLKTRKTGVLYLVLEEAHVFCPKEREGVKDENMAVFWTKRIATASRSQGTRIVSATQRTQSLHNAVLGSSGTLIAHRLTFPADRKPVLDWLKVGMTKELAATVEASLSKLKDGEAWVCCNEADPVIAERRQMPMIKTYDNSSTPTGEEADHIHPPAVDQAALQTIIGEAVKEAEANDPKKLRERIEQLEDQLRDEVGNGPGHDMEQERRLIEERDQARDELADMRRHADELQRQRDVIVQHFAGLSPLIHGVMADCESKLLEVVQLPTDEVDTSAAIPETKSRVPEAPRPIRETPRPTPDTPREGRDHRDVVNSGGGNRAPAAGTADVNGPVRKIATAMLWWAAMGVHQPTREQVGFVAGYVASGGSFRRYLTTAVAEEVVIYEGRALRAGPNAGRVGEHVARTPTTGELHQRVLAMLDGPCRKILSALLPLRGEAMTRTQLGETCGYEASGGSFRRYLTTLSTLKLIRYPNKTTVAASALLFPRSSRPVGQVSP